MKKVKLLFSIPNFITAGSGREMFNIIERLDKNIFEPVIVISKPGGTLYEEILSKGYTVIVQAFNAENVNGIIAKVKTAYKLSKIFKLYGFDIWQSFHWSSDFTEALVARFAGAKYVYVKKNMNWDRLAWRLKSFFSNTIIARNTTLIKTYFSPSYFRKKTFFVTGGVDITKFKPNTANNIRQEYNIPENLFLVVCIAQLVRVKDQATLIKAIAKTEGTYLILAGAQKDEIYLNELQHLVLKLSLTDRVQMPGDISNVNGLLNACDTFVLPTSMFGGHEEGCPVALLEAMAAGAPCIASNVAGSRDLIIPDDTGLIFTPGDEDDLAVCIKKYQADGGYAEKLVSKAVQVVHEKHSLEAEAERFARVYKKMTGIA